MTSQTKNNHDSNIKLSNAFGFLIPAKKMTLIGINGASNKIPN